MATEISAFGPFRVVGVHTAAVPCHLKIETTTRRARFAKASVSSTSLHCRRSSVVDTPGRRTVRSSTSVRETDVDIESTKTGISEQSRIGNGASPLVQLLRQPYILGAFTVSVAVKAWEACGMIADTTAEAAQRELPLGVRLRKSVGQTVAKASGKDVVKKVSSPTPELPNDEPAAIALQAKASSKYVSILPGMWDPLRLGMKDWVWTWWPSAMKACRKNEKALMDASENLNAWVVSGAKWEETRLVSMAAIFKESIDEAILGMKSIVNPKTPVPAPAAPKEDTKGRLAFVRSLPLLRSFIGRQQDASKSPPEIKKENQEEDSSSGVKGGFHFPGIKSRESQATTDIASAMTGLSNKEKAPKPESGVAFSSPLPILQSMRGKSGEGESTTKGSDEADKKTNSPLMAVAETILPTAAKTTQAGPNKGEPKAQTTAQRSAARSEAVKPNANIPAKPTKQAEKGQQDSEVQRKQMLTNPSNSEGRVGVLRLLSETAGTASDKVSRSNNAQVSKQTNNRKVSEPLANGKGLSGAGAKSSGGAVGGPFKSGIKDSSKASDGAAARAVVAGVGSGGVSGGAGLGGSGGGGGDGGSKDEDAKGDGSNTGPEGQFPFGNFAVFIIMATAAAAVILWARKRQSLEKTEEGEEMGLKTASS